MNKLNPKALKKKFVNPKIQIVMKRILYLVLLTIPFWLVSCSGGSNEKEPDQAEETTSASPDHADGSEELSEAMKMVQESVKQLNNGEEVEVVDFRKLKELMPEKLAGMERTTHSGEKTGAMGFKISMAEARYEDGESILRVNITDAGGVGMAIMGLAAWSAIEIDRETESGYERTTTIEGYKSFEKYDGNSRHGELSMIIGERFIVNLEGDNVDEDVFRKAVKKLKVSELEKM